MGPQSGTRVEYIVSANLAFEKLGTWAQFLPSGFFFGFFFFFRGIGPRGLAPPPPLECNSTLPLVTAVFITPKGTQLPGSRRIGVIGALVLILPSETV